MDGDAQRPGGDARQRIDKWLFFSRLVKSRSLAAKCVEAGDVRVNGTPVRQPSHLLRPGDLVALTRGHHLLTVEVLSPGTRRGPYEEARLLYEDITPQPQPGGAGEAVAQAARVPGAGRPTKRERRQTDRLRDFSGGGD